jgi:hypothetical protein
MAKLTFQRLRSALDAKCFTQIEKAGHPKYIYIFDGKATGMPLTVRNGRDELTKGWKSDLTKRMRMPSQEYFEDFVACSVSGQDYKEHLCGLGSL